MDELSSVPSEFSIAHSDPVSALFTPTCTDNRTPGSLAREMHASCVNFEGRWEVLYTATIVLGLPTL